MERFRFIVCGNEVFYYPLHRIAALNPSPQFDINNYSKGAMRPHVYGDDGSFKTEKIVIVVNNVCNLKCAYCYAGKGNKTKSSVVSLDQLKTFVNYIFEAQQEKGETKLQVVFLGGGEPFMSLPLLKNAVEYIHEKSHSVGKERTIEIVTNGTLINGEVVEWIKKYDIRLDVSFEILEDIQQAQRGLFSKVHNALKLLDCNKIKYKTRTVITPLNVSRLVELVDVSKELYPNNKELRMEMVSSKSNDSKFFDDFVKNFFKAKSYGEEMGVKVDNSKLNAFNFLRDYHCYPELALTSEGNISICHRCSNINDPFYVNMAMGKVDDIRVLDKQKIRETFTHTIEECDNCIARYHCGGGCAYNNLMFPNQWENYCKMMKTSVKLHIIKKLVPDIFASYIEESINFDDFSEKTSKIKQSKVTYYPLIN